LLGLKAPEDLGQAVTHLLRGPDFANWLAVQSEVKSPLEMPSPKDDATWLNINAVAYRKGQRLLILRDISDVHNVDKIRHDFVANISHELRTPLTVLLGYLEMLQQNPSDGHADAIERMHSQALKMQDLLADLLELSRLQNDEMHHQEKEVDVPALLILLQKQVEEISKNRHELHFHVNNDLCLCGIASDLESVFRNLIVNAVNYTPEGGRIEVGWRKSEDGAVFSVKDNGIGIPRRDIPRLTERFYRVGSDRARHTGGTGLGLAIVKHVLNAHQARLVIESELGEGSEFICRFPADRLRKKRDKVVANSS
jgi:two-component system phosphate regulon sensor histidine kinase PhoR